MDFEQALNKKIALVNETLEAYVTLQYPEVIYEAMRYSLFAGGKRVRPVLIFAAAEAAGGVYAEAAPFAAAMEMIHTCSLIHDDLPAMDDDDFRRGQPTNHKVFGEAFAILAGDALLNKAFEVMAAYAVERNEPKINRAMQTIVNASGVNGMISGQAVDILSENKQVDTDTLLYMHTHKTGALIEASLVCGAICGGADEKRLEALRQCGQKIGLAFQIKDDILDVTGDFETLGKPIHSDEKNVKTTYVSLYGLKKANADFLRISEEATRLIDGFGEKGAFLKAYASKLMYRNK